MLLQRPALWRPLCANARRVFCFPTAIFTSKSNPEEVHDGEEECEGIPYMDVPIPCKKWQRKPYPTPIKELIRRAKEERRARQENRCRLLEHPPDNGLLVPDLIEVAHKLYNSRRSLLCGLTALLNRDGAPAIKKCRYCSEVHIGHQGHEVRNCEGGMSGARNGGHVWRRGGIEDVIGFPYCYHLYDRVGKPRVGHKERFGFRRLPAILELCIQAGLDLEGYPTKRRIHPVHSIDGRIVDFQPDEEEAGTHYPPIAEQMRSRYSEDPFGEDEELEAASTASSVLGADVLEAWSGMRSGVAKLMKKYGVVTCGYCPEVQVGPKGHKVRMCKATKHQARDGQHAWQEATVDDVVRPNYVWHVTDPGDGKPVPTNVLKRYYGKAPAVVEVCVQAGAPIPDRYRSMMRLNVVPPSADEYDLVA